MLSLWSQVVTSYSPESKCGLPIGSLTSQHLANAYLGQLDRLVTQQFLRDGRVQATHPSLAMAQRFSWESFKQRTERAMQALIQR